MPIIITNPPGGTGTLTGADNGLSLDGTGHIAELGGTLIKNSQIDTAAFTLTMKSTGVGLKKDASITKANQLANPLAYITTDCLDPTSQVGTLNNRLLTALNTTLTLYTVAVGFNQLLRINPALFLNGLGGTTNLVYNLIYTDEAGTVRTVQLTTLSSLTTPTIPTETIYAQKNTAVQLQVIINLAGANYNIYATCDFLGIQNV